MATTPMIPFFAAGGRCILNVRQTESGSGVMAVETNHKLQRNTWPSILVLDERGHVLLKMEDGGGPGVGACVFDHIAQPACDALRKAWTRALADGLMARTALALPGHDRVQVSLVPCQNDKDRYVVMMLGRVEDPANQWFDQSLDMVCIADRDGFFRRVNDSFTTTLGYTREELLARPFLDFVHPDDRDATIAVCQEFQSQLHFENRYVCKDGSVRWLSWSSRPDYKRNLWYAVARDVTEQKVAEAALRASERRFRSLAGMSPIGIFMADAAGACIYLNNRGCEITGLSFEEAAGDGWATRLHPEDRGWVWKSWREAIECQTPFNEEFRFASAEDVTTWVSASAVPIGGARGELTGFMGTVEDTTERLKASSDRTALLEQLHQARKMEAVGRLAGGIAHDFNNLLTVIRGGLDQAAGLLDSEASAHRGLEVIRAAADEAAGVTQALLTFSRHMPTTRIPIDLGDLMTEVTRLLRRMLPAAIELDVVNHCPGAAVVGDRTQLQQLIMNLSINARDAMPEGGRLEISLDRANPGQVQRLIEHNGDPCEGLCMSVRDNGEGIQSNIRDRILEPFFTTKPRGQGTGLGLSIVQAIVQEHDGLLELQSKAGAGVQVDVILPWHNERVWPESESEPIVEPQANGECVLLAEDNPQVRGIISAALRSFGFEVVKAGDGEQALSEIERLECLDLIVLDIDMPKINGMECLKRLRERGGMVPVVLITGNVTCIPDDELDDHTVLLHKPFQMSGLGRLCCDLCVNGSSE